MKEVSSHNDKNIYVHRTAADRLLPFKTNQSM